MSKGMVYVFYGDGKGKTSAALGVCLRMLLRGKTVEWISWFKEIKWESSEMLLPKKFKKNLHMHWMGNGFFGGPLDNDTPEGHKKAAVRAINLARDVLSKKEESGGMVSLLVLDEALKAVDEGLLKLKDLIEVVKLRKATHIILTGHVCQSQILKMADLVTEMRKIKHPYDKGILAISGLDF